MANETPTPYGPTDPMRPRFQLIVEYDGPSGRRILAGIELNADDMTAAVQRERERWAAIGCEVTALHIKEIGYGCDDQAMAEILRNG